jgi:lysozyme
MNISENGLLLIERFEGFVGHPYWDPFGHVWTRGYGETEGISGASPTISAAQAQANLKRLLGEEYEPAVREIQGLNQNQYDALCSFVWNVGPGAIGPQTTLGRFLRAHEFGNAANALLAYDHAGSQVVPDLVMRRQTERALFLTPIANPLAVLEPDERRAVTEYDRDARHPHMHEHVLKELRAQMIAFRKAIWVAAERGVLPDGKPTEKGWDVRNRGHRYQILLSRTS